MLRLAETEMSLTEDFEKKETEKIKMRKLERNRIRNILRAEKGVRTVNNVEGIFQLLTVLVP